MHQMQPTPSRQPQTASARSTAQRSPRQTRQQQQQEADLQAFDAIMSRQSNGAAAIAARNAQLAARMQRPSYASASPGSSAAESSGSSEDDDADDSLHGPPIISDRLDDLMHDSSDSDVETRMDHGHARMFPRDSSEGHIFPSYDERGRQVWPALDPARVVRPQRQQQRKQQARQSDPEDSEADELNRSGELNSAELNALVAEAAQLTGLERPSGAVTARSAQARSNDPREDDSNATLKSKLASERAVLSDLMSKLSALQSQSAELQQMSRLAHNSNEQMKAVLADTRKNAQASDSDGEDEGQSPIASSDEEDQPGFDSQQPYGSASPSDSDIEVEIERQPSVQPADSEDEELSHDAQQLAQLEDWMAVLSKQSERLKAQRQANMSPYEREQDEDEFETDQRLFFSGQQEQEASASEQRNAGRARNRNAGARSERFVDDADEEELREKRRRQHSSRSPITSASPSPPRERARTAPATRGGYAEYSRDSAPRSPVAGIARLPARAVPPVPISRWIGPSALPTAHAGGGSGSHVQYSDRPATAVGTVRSAVAARSTNSYAHHQGSQTGPSPTSGSSTNVNWQAPTLSSLPPRPRQHKAASVSSKGSMFVNAPSERGAPQRIGAWTEGSEIAEGSPVPPADDDFASSEEEEVSLHSGDSDYDDSWFVTVKQHGANQARAAASAASIAAAVQQRRSRSPSPSDSDSELAYTINSNSATTSAASSSRPKTARTVASSHLNGHAAAASASRQQPQQQQSVSASSSGVLLTQRQWVMARIGEQLFRHTIHHVGNTRAQGTELGAGRLGAAGMQREQAADREDRQRQARRAW